MAQREREGVKSRPKSAFLGAATTELQEVSIIIMNSIGTNIMIIINLKNFIILNHFKGCFPGPTATSALDRRGFYIFTHLTQIRLNLDAEIGLI